MRTQERDGNERIFIVGVHGCGYVHGDLILNFLLCLSQSSRIILIQQLVKLVHTITHLTTLCYSDQLTCNNPSLEGSPAFYKIGN